MYDADDGGDDVRVPPVRSSGSGVPQLGFVKKVDYDDDRQANDRTLRSTRTWLGWMTVLAALLAVAVAFQFQMVSYLLKTNEQITSRMAASEQAMQKKADLTAVTAVALRVDTVTVTAARAEKVATAARVEIAAINDDMADAAAAIDEIGNEATKRFNGQVYMMKQAQDMFQREVADSITAVRAWAQGLADQNDQRWGSEAVARNAGDLEIRVRLGRLERWRTVNTGINLVNLAGFIRHVVGDAHHGK